MARQLHDILDTKNKTEQVRRVEHLLQMANAPVVDLIVRYDTRSQQLGISVIGITELDSEAIHQILTAAQDSLRQQEKAALQQQTQPGEGTANFAPEFSAPETIEQTEGDQKPA